MCPVIEARLVGQTFYVAGLPIARDSLAGDIGIHAAIADRIDIRLAYQGFLAQDRQGHGLQAGLNWCF
jgi:uncharacterized protein with beta-barrel porin domain